MKKSKRKGADLEYSIVNDFDDAKLTANSGASFGDGDISSPIFQIEAKQRKGKNININIDILRKIRNEARILGKMPCLIYETEEKEKVCILDYEDMVSIHRMLLEE